jgi:hypothetical protein
MNGGAARRAGDRGHRRDGQRQRRRQKRDLLTVKMRDAGDGDDVMQADAEDEDADVADAAKLMSRVASPPGGVKRLRAHIGARPATS